MFTLMQNQVHSFPQAQHTILQRLPALESPRSHTLLIRRTRHRLPIFHRAPLSMIARISSRPLPTLCLFRNALRHRKYILTLAILRTFIYLCSRSLRQIDTERDSVFIARGICPRIVLGKRYFLALRFGCRLILLIYPTYFTLLK